jgi:Acetyltransferase (GNAT) domain
VRFERLELADVDWEHLNSFADRSVFQTRQWLEFIARSQGAEPVVAELRDGASSAGYFTGLIVRPYGIRVLGSPMPGWTTAFMGFNLEPGVSRRAATEALLEFAFGPLRCLHLELKDRNLTLADVEGLGFDHTPWRGLEVDLRRPKDEIFTGMKRMCRKNIRKAQREGVVIEEADPDGFAEDHYAHVADVFAKQSLVPPFDAERIRQLIDAVHPSGRLLLLRARGPDGASIASGVFPAMNQRMHFLTSGSLRPQQSLRPNEALVWHAIGWGQSRGIETLDLGGYLSYKLKYGGEVVELPFLRKSRSRSIAGMRNLARTAFEARQIARGRLRSGGGVARSTA